MIKAGYSGSQIKEIVWMGNVVNNASKLCNQAKYSFNKTILISNELYDILPKDKQNLFNKNSYEDCYECDEIDSDMNEWIEDNCD